MILQDLSGFQLQQSNFNFTVNDAWACLYVLEGSQMGGLIISKILKKNDKIPSDRMNFFTHNLAERVNRWFKVKGWINQAIMIDRKKLGENVIACFSQLDHCMNQAY